MKIVLDRAKAIRIYGFGIGFYLAVFILGLTIIIWEMPVSWLTNTINSQTNCRLVLHQPVGSLWQGSTAIGFSERDVITGKCRIPNSITDRFQWSLTCTPLQGICRGQIQFSALLKPLGFQFQSDGFKIDAGETILPANILEVLGSPWTTLRPRGEMKAHWSELNLWGVTHQDSKGLIKIVVTNLSSPISPIKPLGTYEVGVNLLDAGGSWDVSTIYGPLIFEGAGIFGKGGLHFSGEVSSSADSKESLVGLLSLMGKKTGDIYKIKF